MGGRRFIRWQSNGALEWTSSLTAVVAGIGVLLIVGSVAIYLLAPAEANRGGFLTYGCLVGGCALVAAIASRFTTVRQLRYSQVDFPSPTASPFNDHHTGRRRVRVRRPSGVPYFFMATIAPGIAASLYIDWDSTPLTLKLSVFALGCAGLAGAYLVGPVAMFVVTPEYLRVDSAFQRVWIPRNPIKKFLSSDTKVAVRLTTGKYQSFRVDSVLWEQRYRTNRATQHRTVVRIVTALQAVPVGVNASDEVIVKPRPVMITLGVIATVTALAAAVVMLNYGNG